MTRTSFSKLNIAVQGRGIVVGEDSKINCHPNCMPFYIPGTVVNLIPTPEEGWEFAGWELACQGMVECSLQIDQDTSAHAVFKRARPGG